jgi:hypothetical protein
LVDAIHTGSQSIFDFQIAVANPCKVAFPLREELRKPPVSVVSRSEYALAQSIEPAPNSPPRNSKETFMYLSGQFSWLGFMLASGLIAASASAASTSGPVSQPAESAAAIKAHVVQDYGKIPLSFEANQGQAVKTVRFISSGSG